jgi:recombinational DNA repair protein (RecF pathway)
MQGYIIDIKTVREDDLIVTILGENNIYTAYRFYGARHSTINIGYKIDFELESNLKSTMPRLKDVIQLGFKWILDNQKMYCWQRYLKLFYIHLKDIDHIDSIYFKNLDNLTYKLNKQNPKRAIIEHYVNLLESEGRLHTHMECLLCDTHIDHDIALVRSFIPTHPNCSYSKGFNKQKIDQLFYDKNLIGFDDNEVEYLWNLLLQGL